MISVYIIQNYFHYAVSDLEQITALFEEQVIDHLKIGKAPVIVLADEALAERIMYSAAKAGFFFVAQPYKDINLKKFITDVLNKPQYDGWAL